MIGTNTTVDTMVAMNAPATPTRRTSTMLSTRLMPVVAQRGH